MGVFGELKKAGKANTGGLYFAPGDRYVVEIQRCSIKDARDGAKYFLVESKILHSLNGKMDVGLVPSWMPEVPGTDNMGLKNVNSFILGVTGEDCDKMSDAEAEALGESIVGTEQLCAGDVVIVETHAIKTKAGNPFTIVKWSQATDADYKLVGRTRAA